MEPESTASVADALSTRPLIGCYLSNCNYRIFVKEMLLEIGIIEIGFISSYWPPTSHIIRSILV